MLAPMAGVTDLAFRETIREISPDVLMFSEMVSAKAMSYGDKNTYGLIRTSPADKPLLSIQIFGHEPSVMAESAKKIEDMGFSYLDINCGCPAPKIVKNGDGAALLKNPGLIYEIVSRVRKAVGMTLSAKLRTGCGAGRINVAECARLVEEAGADFVTVHGRTREMQYSGTADLAHIKMAKDAVSIPVVGNGDVDGHGRWLDMLEGTGCDGVMAGRAALSNPYLFECIKNPNFTFTKQEKIAALLKLAERMAIYGKNPFKEARPRILWYLKGYKNSKLYKEKAVLVNSLADIRSLADEILADNNVY
jgi:nifR3 family TIM-barrel protein